MELRLWRLVTPETIERTEGDWETAVPGSLTDTASSGSCRVVASSRTLQRLPRTPGPRLTAPTRCTFHVREAELQPMADGSVTKTFKTETDACRAPYLGRSMLQSRTRAGVRRKTGPGKPRAA
mmetsp:Transcript_4020/g.11228  ORF Transcript_4020/g.11228 Transcript_4020/m.11228 type:complete len:123 (+) Transcript_4020:900-1268(+)